MRAVHQDLQFCGMAARQPRRTSEAEQAPYSAEAPRRSAAATAGDSGSPDSASSAAAAAAAPLLWPPSPEAHRAASAAAGLEKCSRALLRPEGGAAASSR